MLRVMVFCDLSAPRFRETRMHGQGLEFGLRTGFWFYGLEFLPRERCHYRLDKGLGYVRFRV